VAPRGMVIRPTLFLVRWRLAILFILWRIFSLFRHHDKARQRTILGKIGLSRAQQLHGLDPQAITDRCQAFLTPLEAKAVEEMIHGRDIRVFVHVALGS